MKELFQPVSSIRNPLLCFDALSVLLPLVVSVSPVSLKAEINHINTEPANNKLHFRSCQRKMYKTTLCLLAALLSTFVLNLSVLDRCTFSSED